MNILKCANFLNTTIGSFFLFTTPNKILENIIPPNPDLCSFYFEKFKRNTIQDKIMPIPHVKRKLQNVKQKKNLEILLLR